MGGSKQVKILCSKNVGSEYKLDKYRFIFLHLKKILIYNFLPGKRCITGSSLNNQDEQELQIHFDMAPRAREYGFFFAKRQTNIISEVEAK